MLIQMIARQDTQYEGHDIGKGTTFNVKSEQDARVMEAAGFASRVDTPPAKTATRAMKPESPKIEASAPSVEGDTAHLPPEVEGTPPRYKRRDMRAEDDKQ